MLYVDDRAGSKDLMKYDFIRSNATVTRLDPAGDVMFSGNGPDGAVLVGVEVKSVWDLITSIATGRLQATQIPAMLDTYDINWLLCFGEYRASPDGVLQIQRHNKWRNFRLGARPVPFGYVESLLSEFTAIGVHVKQVHDERSAATWIGVLYRWWSKQWSEHKGMRTLDRSREISLVPGMTHETLDRISVAAQLPGVGFDRATAAAEHFTSILQMINAPSQEWEKIPGIGKTIARAVVESIRREEP